MSAAVHKLQAGPPLTRTCRDLSSPDGRLTTFLTQTTGVSSTRTARAL